MRVKELKQLLEEVDENLEVIIFDGEGFLPINEKETGESTFSGACDENGDLIPYGYDKEFDYTAFVVGTSIMGNNE